MPYMPPPPPDDSEPVPQSDGPFQTPAPFPPYAAAAPSHFGRSQPMYGHDTQYRPDPRWHTVASEPPHYPPAPNTATAGGAGGVPYLAEHPGDPGDPVLSDEVARRYARQWNMLVSLPWHEVIRLVTVNGTRETPHMASLRDLLLRARTVMSGNTWHTRYFFLPRVVGPWTSQRLLQRSKPDVVNAHLKWCAELEQFKFPRAMRDQTDAQAAADAWDGVRQSFAKAVERLVMVGCPYWNIFNSIETAARHPDRGNPRVLAHVENILEDSTLSINPLIACDIFFLICDLGFARASTGFSRDSASIEWERLTRRLAGVNIVDLVRAIVRAFLKKQDDPLLNETNVWENPQMQHALHTRTQLALYNDEGDLERGRRNAAQYLQVLEQRRARVNHGGAPVSTLSAIDICLYEMEPFERAQALLLAPGSAAKPVAAAMPMYGAPPATPNTARAPPPTPSAPSAARAYPAAHPIQPPASYSAATTPMPPLNVPSGGHGGSRTCPPPTGRDKGVPPYANAVEWTDQLWARARLNTRPMTMSDPPWLAHPTLARAFAKVFPADATRTTVRSFPPSGVPESGGAAWTNLTGCMYCQYAPMPPPGTAEADMWRYGTGNGRHNPISCQCAIRWLCEAGAGEVEASVAPYLHKLISLKRVDPLPQ